MCVFKQLIFWSAAGFQFSDADQKIVKMKTSYDVLTDFCVLNHRDQLQAKLNDLADAGYIFDCFVLLFSPCFRLLFSHRLLQSSKKPLKVFVGIWDDDATMLAQKTKVILGYLMYDDKVFNSKVGSNPRI